jgi:hypothetical protein
MHEVELGTLVDIEVQVKNNGDITERARAATSIPEYQDL